MVKPSANVASSPSIPWSRLGSNVGTFSVAAERGVINWETLTELGDVVSGRAPGRTSDSQITLFESQGLAIQDVATAMRIYELAREQNLGQEIDVF